MPYGEEGMDPGSPSLCPERKDLTGGCGGGLWNADGTEGRGCAFAQDTNQPGEERRGGCPLTARELMQGSSTS